MSSLILSRSKQVCHASRKARGQLVSDRNQRRLQIPKHGPPFIEWSDHDCQVCLVSFLRSASLEPGRMQNADVACSANRWFSPEQTGDVIGGPNPKLHLR